MRQALRQLVSIGGGVPGSFPAADTSSSTGTPAPEANSERNSGDTDAVAYSGPIDSTTSQADTDSEIDEKSEEFPDDESMGPGPTLEQRKRIRNILAALATRLGDPDPSFVDDVAGYSEDPTLTADDAHSEQSTASTSSSTSAKGFGQNISSRKTQVDAKKTKTATATTGNQLTEDDVFAMLQRRMKAERLTADVQSNTSERPQ
jgi:hypothetical protein